MDLTCTDTCCLINLIRGEVLDLAATTLEREICIQGLVEDELKADAEQVRLLVEAGKIRLVSGADLFASEVGIIASSYNLGLGEAECLALARKVGCSLASDDGKARRTAIAELGKTR